MASMAESLAGAAALPSTSVNTAAEEPGLFTPCVSDSELEERLALMAKIGTRAVVASGRPAAMPKPTLELVHRGWKVTKEYCYAHRQELTASFGNFDQRVGLGWLIGDVVLGCKIDFADALAVGIKAVKRGPKLAAEFGAPRRRAQTVKDAQKRAAALVEAEKEEATLRRADPDLPLPAAAPPAAKRKREQEEPAEEPAVEHEQTLDELRAAEKQAARWYAAARERDRAAGKEVEAAKARQAALGPRPAWLAGEDGIITEIPPDAFARIERRYERIDNMHDQAAEAVLAALDAEAMAADDAARAAAEQARLAALLHAADACAACPYAQMTKEWDEEDAKHEAAMEAIKAKFDHIRKASDEEKARYEALCKMHDSLHRHWDEWEDGGRVAVWQPWEDGEFYMHWCMYASHGSWGIGPPPPPPRPMLTCWHARRHWCSREEELRRAPCACCYQGEDPNTDAELREYWEEKNAKEAAAAGLSVEEWAVQWGKRE